jgi:predicted aminopeptidase
VVWNVFATPEFSTDPQWCYLIVGCAAYRGYFHDVMRAISQRLALRSMT